MKFEELRISKKLCKAKKHKDVYQDKSDQIVEAAGLLEEPLGNVLCP